MKKSLLNLITLIAAVVPSGALAQSNVAKAFDAIIKSSDAKIAETHTLEKDPMTGLKSGQCDIYNFELPSSKFQLIKNVTTAFEKDNDNAYTMYSGTPDGNENVVIEVAVGDASTSGPRINDPGYEYKCALFLAPISEDPSGIYRYAYGISWREEGSRILGKIFVTYATTLQYRQRKQQERQLGILNSWDSKNGAYIITSGGKTPAAWFDQVMSCLQAIPEAKQRAGISFATKAYKLVRDMNEYGQVKQSDKDVVIELIKSLDADPKIKEPMIKTLLQRSLVELSKN